MESVIHAYLLVFLAGVMIYNSVRKYCETWMVIEVMKMRLEQQNRMN